MRVNIKKILLVIIIFTLIVLVGIFIEIRKTDTTSPFQINDLRGLPAISDNTSINFTKINYNLPQKITVYRTEKKPFTEDEINQIVDDFEVVDENPLDLEDTITGRVLLYQGRPGESLTIEPNPRIVQYKTGHQPDDRFVLPIDEQYYESLARQFLEKITFISNEELILNRVSPFRIENNHIAGRDNPNVINVIFTTTLDGINVITQTYETGNASVYFNDKHNIISVYIHAQPQLTNMGDFTIKSLDEIKSSTMNEAKIISFNDGIINITKFNTSQIKSIDIDEIEPAYLQTIRDTNQRLDPVLLLKGIAKTDGEIHHDQTEAPIILILPAISENP